jgi:hypothetical protein
MPAAIGAAPGAKEKTRLGGIFPSSGLPQGRGLRDQMRRPEIATWTRNMAGTAEPPGTDVWTWPWPWKV